MGKWVEVKCNCPDREPVLNSRWFDDPLLQRKHLTSQKREDAQQWAENVRGMYKCGHRDGMLIEFAPNDLFRVGEALDAAYKGDPERFEIFRRIHGWRNYNDEYLALSPEEALLWQLEIEQLRLFLSGEEFMGFHEKEAFERALAQDRFHEGNIQETLTDGVSLCEASMKTGNFIEFRW